MRDSDTPLQDVIKVLKEGVVLNGVSEDPILNDGLQSPYHGPQVRLTQSLAWLLYHRLHTLLFCDALRLWKIPLTNFFSLGLEAAEVFIGNLKNWGQA